MGGRRGVVVGGARGGGRGGKGGAVVVSASTLLASRILYVYCTNCTHYWVIRWMFCMRRQQMAALVSQDCNKLQIVH